MKRIIITTLAVFFGFTTALVAQENRDVKKEKETTKVKIDKGIETDTVVIEEVDEEVEVIEVEGTNKTNQDSKRIKEKDSKEVILKEEKAKRKKVKKEPMRK